MTLVHFVAFLAGPLFLTGAMRDTLHQALPKDHDTASNGAGKHASEAAPPREVVKKAETMEVVFGKSSLQLHRNSSSGQPKGGAPQTSASTGGGTQGMMPTSSGVDLFVSETAATNHALAQLLGIEGGSLCPSASKLKPSVGLPSHVGVTHGCRLGCRCGVLQSCYSKSYDGPGFPGGEGLDGVDIGVCRLAFPYLMAIFTAVMLTVWVGVLCLRRAAKSKDLSNVKRPKPSRSELDSRLRSATALNNEQRKAILDEFCSKKVETYTRLIDPKKGQHIPLTDTQVSTTT